MLSIFLFFVSFFSLLKTLNLLINKEWGKLPSLLSIKASVSY